MYYSFFFSSGYRVYRTVLHSSERDFVSMLSVTADLDKDRNILSMFGRVFWKVVHLQASYLQATCDDNTGCHGKYREVYTCICCALSRK